MADSDLFVSVAAELIGAEIGAARRPDLERAVRAATEAAGHPLDPPELARRLRSAAPDDPVRRAFVGALTISETRFFRLREQFDALAERALPGLLVARQATRRLRLWSAGCSTGEETWTLAILLERLLPAGWDATILATDVDGRALETARRGVYREHSFRDTPASLRARWFTPTPEGWEILPALRRRVRFAELNLVTDGYPSAANGTGGIDLLLCRNVLMYLTAAARARVAARLGACLASGGWLAVAPAEVSPGAFPDLAVHNFPGAILHQRTEVAARAVSAAPAGPAPPPASPRSAPPAGASRRSAPERLAAARALADRGEVTEAERVVAEALEADPLLAEARELRALLLLERGDDETAESELRAVLFLEPDRTLAQATLSALLARRQSRSA
jgi:chemotaxis protein methyltransferase CheR